MAGFKRGPLYSKELAVKVKNAPGRGEWEEGKRRDGERKVKEGRVGKEEREGRDGIGNLRPSHTLLKFLHQPVNAQFLF